MEKPVVMGILNITDDSFYDGGLYKNVEKALKQTELMLNDGAVFIDIGAQSTRPGAALLKPEDELNVLIMAIENISQAFPEAIISVDTFYSKVAKEAISAGAHLVNDISAGNMDNEMLDIVSKLKVPFIAMHMKGTPQTMQQNPEYDNVTKEVMSFFADKIHKIIESGINDYIIDPGFGFGKTIVHNYELLNNLQNFQVFDAPVLVGLSRKGMIWKTLNSSAKEALNGTTVANTIALLKGAHILRVHDVKEAVECIKIVSQL